MGLQLISKLPVYGYKVAVVNRWYLSANTCHNCGRITQNLQLKDRQFDCPNCGYSSN
ncbi:zinc ribbon domain-containing protein [Kamptonema sp. PCC 6506]|uniref:zinc ribbon domain-containing protein n=1 Tax=Kamptonema sp. PCC 6506 TaxID=272129 RepID=UPI000A060BDD